jgi:hypothetical protein
MRNGRAVQGLTSAAAELCAAHEALAAAGYETWSAEIRALIDIIDAEIDWLRGEGLAIRLSSGK